MNIVQIDDFFAVPFQRVAGDVVYPCISHPQNAGHMVACLAVHPFLSPNRLFHNQTSIDNLLVCIPTVRVQIECDSTRRSI